MELQAPWINGISDGLLVHRVAMALRKNLERNDETEERA